MFYWGMVHNPATWSYAHGPFIFRRWMVWHPRFLLSLDSQTLSFMVHLRFRCICFASTFLGISCMLAWRVLGGIWYPLCQLHQICFTWVSAPYYLGVLGHDCLACPWSSLERFISTFWALPGALVRLSTSWGYPITREISTALIIAWSCLPCLEGVCLLTLSI